jgi:hypothetical protein
VPSNELGLYCPLSSGDWSRFCWQKLNEGRVTLHRRNDYRSFSLVGTLAFLGLAACVFAWGLQYKLSLYDPPQAASHQIPTAKLLTKNEQSSATESPLSVRLRTFTGRNYPGSAAVLFVLFLAVSRLILSKSNQREHGADRLWHLRRRAFRNSLFVRPPPALV